MKISKILVLSALSAIVECNMFAAAARGLYQPVILSIGAMLAAIDQKVEPILNESFWEWDGYFDKNMKKKKWDDPKEGRIPADRNQKKWEDWEDMKEMTTALKKIDKEYKDSGARGLWKPDWAPKTP